MPRRIYISCDVAERELAAVQEVCAFLQAAGCETHFAPLATTWCGYRALEQLIEQADAFVAVVGQGYNSATWLNHELSYAHALNRFRRSPRPRLFGLRIPPHDLPRCSRHIELEWLDETTRELLLADVPERR